MKIVVDKVQTGLVPYGPGNGTHAIGITFKEVEGEFDTTLPKDVDGNDIQMSEDEAIANNIFLDITRKIKDGNMQDDFTEFLLGHRYCYFIGDAISSLSYRNYMMIFYEVLSHAALELQKKIFKDSSATKGDIMKQLRAPLTGYVCSPVNFTGKSAFYENFNIILNKVPMTENNDDWNPMAFVEIQNHKGSFHVLEFTSDDFESKKKNLEEKFLKVDAITVMPDRVFIIDRSGDEKIAEYSTETGWRLNHPLSYNKVLDM